MDILPGFRSDHSMLSCDIEPFEIKRGRGLWRLNNTILAETQYVQGVNEIIENVSYLAKELNYQEKWEMLKRNMIDFSKLYAIRRAQEKKLILAQLEEKLLELEEQFQMECVNEEENEYTRNLMLNTRAELEALVEEKVKGAIFRSKAQWYGEGEKASKYFLNLEKSRSGAKGMNVLLQNDREVTNPQDILGAQHDYYKSLYTSDNSISFDYKNNTETKLTQLEKDSMAGIFSIDELRTALKSSK